MKLRLLLPIIPDIPINNVFPATSLSNANKRYFGPIVIADVFYKIMHLVIKTGSIFPFYSAWEHTHQKLNGVILRVH